jgi:predicted aspartyl protease
MTRPLRTRISTSILLWVGFAAVSGQASAWRLDIDEGKISVLADRVPLQALLQRMSFYGIVVRIDPTLNPAISATFANKDLEEGLKSLIRPLSSVFIWKADPHNAGTYRLSEIQIFKPGEKDRMVHLEREPDAAGGQAPLESSSETAPFETRVVIKADRVFVPVVLSYNDKKIETSLVFDTGANSIVIHQNVADALGIADHVKAKGYGVGGIQVDARVAKLQAVQVGPYEKHDLRAAIVDYSGPPDSQYNGLLGMNFLRGLTYEIDFEAQVIRWGKNPANRR